MTHRKLDILALKDRGPYGRATFDQFASQSPEPDNDIMPTPTREELDAKFERTEARVDARLAEFQRTTSEALGEIKGELKAIHADLGNLKSLKWQIWTSMAAAVALVFAIVTYGASTFESGRNTAVVIHDAQQKIDETAATMKKQQEETQKVLQEAIKALTQAQSTKP
ncbi:hypothetical protein ACOTFF_15685 [Achromobacter xylosoxidans]